MTAQQFDRSGYKIGQRQQWNSVADAWRKWWPSIERGAQVVSERLADAIGAKAGDRLLDVSTGIGEPAVTLAKIVGSTGSVVATDQSPGMLAVARERIAEERQENIELIESDTESLDVPENQFDGAVCRWGLMFLPDLKKGLGNVRDSLKPGAKFATAVWGTPDQVPFASLPMAVARQVLDPPPLPPPAEAPSLFALGAPGALTSALQESGFSDVQIDSIEVRFELASPREYCEFLSDLTPPVRAMLEGRDAAQAASFWDAVEQKAGAFVSEKGVFSMPNLALVAVGTAS